MVSAVSSALSTNGPTTNTIPIFSPLTQITPANVSTLTRAWTFNYGAGSLPSGTLGLDFRFEVWPLIIDGVMYISTPFYRPGIRN